MKKNESYKVKYELAQAHEQVLIDEIAKLKAEVTELHWQNESLMIENKRLLKVKERYFEAGVQVARLCEKLKTENIKLKIRNNFIEHKEVMTNV